MIFSLSATLANATIAIIRRWAAASVMPPPSSDRAIPCHLRTSRLRATRPKTLPLGLIR